MRIRMTATLAPLLALGALTLPVGAAGQSAVPTEGVEVSTVPPIAGVKVASAGRTFETDSEGRLRLPPETGTLEVTRTPRLGKNSRVRFDGIYRRPSGRLTLFFEVFHRAKPRFVDTAGKPINPERVESITLKSRTGVVRTIESDLPVWLLAQRVVRFADGLEVKDVEWSVQEVLVDGSNVVNRSQFSFVPSKNRSYEVPLLFYSASFEVSDALLGFPIGSAIELRYPDGTVRRHELDGAARVTLPGLARGTYDVSVDGPGYSFTPPVSVTDDQEMSLEVVSYLDLLIVAGAFIAVVVGLLLARRPALRTRARAMASSLPGISAPNPDPAPSSVRPSDNGSSVTDPLEELAEEAEQGAGDRPERPRTKLQ